MIKTPKTKKTTTHKINKQQTTTTQAAKYKEIKNTSKLKRQEKSPLNSDRNGERRVAGEVKTCYRA
jgi:hypothetical protein